MTEHTDMHTPTAIHEAVSVEKRVRSAEGGERSSEEGREWHVTVTVSSDHEVPVAVRVSDRIPASVRPADVTLPSNGTEEEGDWRLDGRQLTSRTVVRPDETVTGSYRLHADVDRDELTSDVTIDGLRSIDLPIEDAGAESRARPDASRSSQTDDGRPVAATDGGGVRSTSGDTALGDSTDTGDRLDAEDRGDEGGSGARFETSERAAADSPWLVPRESATEPVISIVMPTMNEEAGIQECIDRVKTALDDLGVYGEIIVSDSSDDRTPDIAAEHGAHVVTPDRAGYGYAYRYAFERVRGEYVVIGDADTTYNFAELPRLFEHLQQTDADMVMGSRLEGEIKPGAMPRLHQYVGNPLLTKFLNLFYEAGVSDAHSGFRLIRREALARLNLQSDGMEFASEMIMQAAERGLRIEEVPIVYHPREGEATLESFQDGWRHVRFMLLNAPGYLFTGPAIGLGLVGIVLMALSLLNRPLAGVYFGTHTMIAGSLLVIVGYQVGSLGMFSAVAAEPIRSPRDPVTEWILDRMHLEHGMTLGLGLFTGSALYTTYLLVRWVDSGYEQLPIVPVNMVAFTGLALGVQTVFYAFFLSHLVRYVNQDSDRDAEQ